MLEGPASASSGIGSLGPRPVGASFFISEGRRAVRIANPSERCGVGGGGGQVHENPSYFVGAIQAVGLSSQLPGGRVFLTKSLTNRVFYNGISRNFKSMFLLKLNVPTCQPQRANA